MTLDLKLGQALISGEKRVIVVRDGAVSVFSDGGPASTLEVLSGCSGLTALSRRIHELIESHGPVDIGPEEDVLKAPEQFRLLMPVDAPEIWAVGVTYKRQAAEHDNDIETRTGATDRLYQYVYENPRAEVFFKGFARTCSGPNEPLTIRADSEQVMPEAEMVLVLGEDALPIGYTLGNDLTAWDIERECPLYLNQAKIWDGASSIGPYIVPADAFGDPYDCHVKCQVFRGDDCIIDSEGSTVELKRSLEELCYYLAFNNTVPAGTLLFTGTACVIPHDFALAEGDVVSVSVEGLGVLENPMKKLPTPPADFTTR